MGRRASKAGKGVAATPDFDTVGMTILPGHPLPEWADPQQAGTAGLEAMELRADEWAQPEPHQLAEVDEAYASPEQVAAAAMAAAGVSGAWAASSGPSVAHPAAPQAPAHPHPGAPTQPDGAAAMRPSYPPAAQDQPSPFVAPVPAMAAAGVMAGAAAMSTAERMGAAPASMAPPAPAASAPPAPAATPYPPTTGSSPTPVGAGGPHVPAMGAGGFPAGTFGMSAAGAAVGSAVGAPTAAAATPSAETSAHPAQPSAPEAAGPALTAEHMAHSAATATVTEPAPPGGSTPSREWTSPERPELSPEHVALLAWWADMIAKGQVPAPPGAPAATSPAAARATAPAKDPGSKGRWVALGLAGVVVVGLGVAFGPAVVGAVMGGDPEPVPATELTMPATVGDLVAVTGPDASAQLESLVGFSLRPAGVTVTAAYGTDPAGPVVLGAVASTVAPDADATGQLNGWAAQSAATLGEPVAGSGSTAGITCAASEGTDAVPAGSMCVWSGRGMSGRTYVVSTEPAAALERTGQVRAAMPTATS